jgi:thiol peroxidase
VAKKKKSLKSKAEPRQVFVQGVPASLAGKELRVGMHLPDFKLVTFENGVISTFTRQDLLDTGRPCLFCCMTSVDMRVGTVQARKFERHLSMFNRAVMGVLVSSDLPFTMNRFVAHEVIEYMIPASDDRAGTFGKQFGILLAEHAVLTRAVFVVDQNGIVQHSQVVTEFTDEPDYQGAMDVVAALA